MPRLRSRHRARPGPRPSRHARRRGSGPAARSGPRGGRIEISWGRARYGTLAAHSSPISLFPVSGMPVPPHRRCIAVPPGLLVDATRLLADATGLLADATRLPNDSPSVLRTFQARHGRECRFPYASSASAMRGNWHTRLELDVGLRRRGAQRSAFISGSRDEGKLAYRIQRQRQRQRHWSWSWRTAHRFEISRHPQPQAVRRANLGGGRAVHVDRRDERAALAREASAARETAGRGAHRCRIAAPTG